MNLESIDFRFFIETDNSPFILFGGNGKILYLNNAAEILLGYVNRKELFDITLSYAPKDFGAKTSRMELQYENFIFYALTVAYENEDEIALRLYHKPRIDSAHTIEMSKYAETDINMLLEANITLFKLQNDNALSLLTDQDLPLCKIDQNRLSKLLRKVFNSFRASDSITVSLTLLLGEYIIIEEKRQQLIELAVKANGRYTDHDKEIREIAGSMQITPTLKEHSIHLHIPLIQ